MNRNADSKEAPAMAKNFLLDFNSSARSFNFDFHVLSSSIIG
jgi:hypothetical protein